MNFLNMNSGKAENENWNWKFKKKNLNQLRKLKGYNEAENFFTFFICEKDFK